VIQFIYKEIEIELEMQQQSDGYWKCDYMLITHPERQVTRVKGRIKFPTLKMAKEYTLEDARSAIDEGAYLGSGVREEEYSSSVAAQG
jgi:hypothetical protein